MADEPLEPSYGSFAGEAEEFAALTSDHPQQLHVEKLELGIEEMAPGMVALRRMGDIQALTRSRDVRQFGTNMGLLEGDDGEAVGLSGRHVAIPLELDGAEHTKWRKILDPVFTPKKMALLEPRVRERASELIDAFVDRGEVDAYLDWCEPLPSSIFLSIMGIPQSQLEAFLAFKNTILGGAFDPSITPEVRMAAFDACDAWFAADFDRRDASGEYSDDLIGWLMTTEFDGRRISRDELHGICNLLMIAGLDTVAASLACILARLASHPDERAALLNEPAKWPTAIEELMRFESPVTQGFRHVVADVELPSGTLPSGTNAIVWWAGANVDPQAFDDPLTVKLDRSPNAHISFASGWHRCLGSHLARMELRAALDVWHTRIPDYRIADGTELVYSVNPRAPHNLPLVWQQRVMRMAIQKTGPFGFGLMYHVIHLSDDVHAINAWYQKVFDADVWWPADGPNWSEVEDRYAALIAVSDLCVESMAPKQPADDRYPVGRFYLRHGSRFHSLGFLIDDIEGFARYLIDRDVYIGLPGGGRMEDVPPDIYYFYPSPRSVGGLMAQITRNTDGAYSPAVGTDPRLQDDWDKRALRWSQHPLGIRRFGYATMAVADVDATKATLVDLWQAVPVHDGVDEGRGVRSSFLQLGHFLLELASPLSDNGPVAEHVAQFGDMLYQLTFLVDDLDAVEAYLPTVGVRCARTSAAVITANSDDCLGANYAFSTETCPGDPLGT